MRLLQIFDLLLVTLALSSILLTLVSYVLHKLGQLPGRAAAAGAGNAPLIEGVYFRRFVPEAAHGSGGPAIDARPASPGRLRLALAAVIARFGGTAWFYATLSVVIFFTLLAQAWVHERQADSPAGSSQRATERYLQRKGLMQVYPYKTIPEAEQSALLSETVAPGQRDRFAGLLQQLRLHRIELLAPESAAAETRASATAWEEFLKRRQIPFRRVGAIETVAGDDPASTVVIIPRGALGERGDRAALDRRLARGGGAIASGPLGNAADPTWTASVFGVQLGARAANGRYLPSLFATTPGRAPNWDLPAGILLNWYPAVNDLQAIAVRGDSAIEEASYRGEPVEPRVTRLQLNPVGRGRAAWLALEPGGLANADAAGEFYRDAALVSAMGWAAGVPTARVAPWKDGATAAVAFSMDSEDQFGNVDHVIDLLREEKLPASFFVVSKLFQQHPEMMDRLSPGMELQSHSENHDAFESQSASKQFKRIEDSRLEIEGLSRTRVSGFRPPFERFDTATVDAAAQNRLDFFVGDGRIHRRAPLWIAGGQLLYVPRLAADDYEISRELGPQNATEAVSRVLRDLRAARESGGLFVLNTHTQIFGREEYAATLRELVHAIAGTPDVWKSGLGGIARWWRERDRIELRWETDDRDRPSELTVLNGNPRAVEGVTLELDGGPGASVRVVPAEDAADVRIDTRGSVLRVHLPELAANSSLKLRIERAAASGGRR